MFGNISMTDDEKNMYIQDSIKNKIYDEMTIKQLENFYNEGLDYLNYISEPIDGIKYPNLDYLINHKNRFFIFDSEILNNYDFDDVNKSIIKYGDLPPKLCLYKFRGTIEKYVFFRVYNDFDKKKYIPKSYEINKYKIRDGRTNPYYVNLF